MQYISIEGCSKKVSQLIKGSDYFFLNQYEEAKEHLTAYIKLGGNTIDTAHVYTGGESEQVIGKLLQELGNREDIVLLTKGGIPNASGPRLHREAIDEEVFTSLERLQTSYIDMYALHRDDPDREVSDILETLNEHIMAGRIQAIGTSNWTAKRIIEANTYASEHGLAGFTFNSPNLSLATPQEAFWGGVLWVDEEMRALHEQVKLPLLSWSPLARGFFTGRFTPDQRTDADIVRVYYNEQNWARYARAEKLADEKGCALIQIALAYVLNQNYPVCAIIGARGQDELDSCYYASSMKLTQEELAYLEGN